MDLGPVPHSIPHSMFANSAGLFVVFCKFHTYSTNLHTHRATDLAVKIFQEIPLFSRKTYIVCKIGTKVVFLGI